MALKKVALRKLEDGIPNQALREIKALQEIEDNPYVSVFKTLKDLAFLFNTHISGSKTFHLYRMKRC